MLQLLIAGAMAMAVPQQMDTTFAVRPGGRLVVDTYAGAVIVQSWGRNEIRVQATPDARSEVDIDQNGTTVAIDGTARDGKSNVRFVIHVPRSFRIEVDAVRAAVSVEGIDGDVVAETVEGSVTARDITGRVSAESVSGLVTVENVRGDVTASSTNGGLRLSSITGDVSAEAVNGSITLLDIQSGNVDAETVNGGIVFGSTIRDGGSYTASTTNGSITMAVPENANASFETSTFSGSVTSSMNLMISKQRGGERSFRIGNGSARVALESFAGAIRLVRPDELASVKGKQSDR